LSIAWIFIKARRWLACRNQGVRLIPLFWSV
jgi:hypothetical protein